jgi:cytochrome c oxidase subunit 2
MRLISNFSAGLVLVAAAVAAVSYTAVSPASNVARAETGWVIQITASQFKYEPETITLKRGEPVVLEFHTTDRKHGFKLGALDLHADIMPGEVARIAFTPDKVGRFVFACDNFCGSGHEEMDGTLVVTE